MDVGSFPKRREREGMRALSLQGCIHGVSQNKTPDSKHQKIHQIKISLPQFKLHRLPRPLRLRFSIHNLWSEFPTLHRLNRRLIK
jgi:hypothetical protein